MPEILSALEDYFDCHDLSAAGCPVRISCVLPSAKALKRWPAYPAAARPEAGRLANGRGLSVRDCRGSGLGEAVELASCCAWGDEATLRSSLAELGSAALSPASVTGHDDLACSIRRDWNLRYVSYDWRPAVYDPDRRIEWVPATSAFDGRDSLVPADFVYIGLREPGDEESVAIADSNGCACGADITSAKLSALLELVERDATGRWWYAMRQRPFVPLDFLEDNSELILFLRDRPRKTTLYDITTDLGIPCIAAASHERDGSAVALGFSANPDPMEASLSAVTEMVQSEAAIAAAQQTDTRSYSLLNEWLTRVSGDMPVFAASVRTGNLRRRESTSAATALSACLEACERAGCPIFFLDMTRTEFGAPTVRAISPALCHFKPRMGRDRLFDHDSRDVRQLQRMPPKDGFVPLLI